MGALGLGLIAAFAWGFHDICVRNISQKTPLLASLLTVLVVGLLFHLGLMVAQDGFETLARKPLIFAVLSGVCFLGASIGLYGAFKRGPVRLVAPIIASYPVLSVGMAALRGAEVAPLQWLAVIAVVMGVSLVAALSHDPYTEVPPKGPTMMLAGASAVGFAGTFGFGQMAVEMSADLPVTLVTRVVAILLLLGILAAWCLPFWPGARAAPVLALMGLADGIALNCVLSAGVLPDAQYASVAASVFGMITIVLAWAILRERMTGTQWAGCAITFCGIGYLAL